MTEANRSTARACPLCREDGAEHFLTGYDRLEARPEEYEYVRCGGCGLVRQSPLPAPAEIPSLYPDDYDAHSGDARKRKDKWINRMAERYFYRTDSVTRSAVLRALFGLLSGRIMRDVHAPRGQNRMLDVGCGAGNLLLRHRDLGWSVKGIEMSPRACTVARSRGIDVHEGSVYDAPFEEGSFDLIVLSHVIEHVLEPDRFLARCASFLAPAGLLVLETPNAAGIGFSIYGSCWFPLEAPRHLMLFDRRTIRLLGEKAGLEPRRVLTPAYPRMFCESRHYVKTQGRVLPSGLDERRRIVERSKEEKQPYRGFRKLIRPLSVVGSWLGRGEFLKAEFVARGST